MDINIEGQTYKVAIKKQHFIPKLFKLFNNFGSVSSIITEKNVTYISYMSPQAAVNCYKALKGDPSIQAMLPHPISIENQNDKDINKVDKSKPLKNSELGKYYVARKRDWASAEALDSIVDSLINDRYKVIPILLKQKTPFHTSEENLKPQIPDVISALDLHYAQENERIVMFDVLIGNFPVNCNENVVYQLIKDILPIQHFKIDFYNFNNPNMYRPLFCIAHFTTKDVANLVITSLNRKPFYYKKLFLFTMEEIESLSLALDGYSTTSSQI